MAQIVESNLDVVTSLDSDTDFIRCISNGNSRNITPKNLSKIIHDVTFSIVEFFLGGSRCATIDVTATSPQTDPISITVENNDSAVVSCFVLRHE